MDCNLVSEARRQLCFEILEELIGVNDAEGSSCVTLLNGSRSPKFISALLDVVRTTKVNLRTKVTLVSSKQKDSEACSSSTEQKTKKVMAVFDNEDIEEDKHCSKTVVLPRRGALSQERLEMEEGREEDLEGASDMYCVGLTNLGNTCYMNVTLQLMFCVPQLTTALLDCSMRQAGLMREMISLTKKASSGHYLTLSTQPFKRELEGVFQQYTGYQQHDAHELLIELLNSLHERFTVTPSLYNNRVEDEEMVVDGVPANNDFVMETNIENSYNVATSNLVSPVKIHSNISNVMSPNVSEMNISPSSKEENLNSLSTMPQRGRVHENLPINLIEPRVDSTLHKNILHYDRHSEKCLPEKSVYFCNVSEGEGEERNIPNIASNSPSNHVEKEEPLFSFINKELDKCNKERAVSPVLAVVKEGKQSDNGPGGSEGEVERNKAWSDWQRDNKTSVITDTFYGQFTTHVICCMCGASSVKYEPYSHISLPLPHATDRHVVITWVPRPGDSKTSRYLVTVSQYGSVLDLKTSLLLLIDKNVTTADVTVAEVHQQSVLIIHSNTTPLRHVNDCRNSVYVFERCRLDEQEEKSQPEDANFFSNNLDTDVKYEENNRLSDSNIEVNIDVNKNCKMFKNKLDLFDPEAKIENKPCNKGVEVVADWAQCVICLEDFPPSSLYVHVECGMSLCAECYESLKKSNQAIQCPVCGGIMLNLKWSGSDENCTIRWSDTPILWFTSGKVVGHPYLAELPSRVTGRALKQFLTTLLPPSVSFDATSLVKAELLLSNTTDLSKRVVVEDDSTLLLLSSHCLLISLASFPTSVQDTLLHITDTESLKKLEQSLKPLELQDCLSAFVKSEELSTGNMWNCPQCGQDQSAITSTSISRLPRVLVLQLNRFMVLNSTSYPRTEKLTCPVHIPLHDLDISCITSPDVATNPYSLCGIVHHTGGIASGHYTAHTLSSEDNKWRYYNDTQISLAAPSSSEGCVNDADAKSAYVLLYKENIP